MTTTGHRAKRLDWHFEGDCIRVTSHVAGRSGYTLFQRYNRLTTIPRHIIERRHGADANGKVARHTCDNKWCCNPSHILIGTHADNVRDKVERGRARGPAKLSLADIEAIRNASGAQHRIAAQFGVDQSYVSLIKNSKRERKH